MNGTSPPPVPVWALAERRTLCWLIVLGIVINAAAISPIANDAAETSSLVHYTQHGVIYTASALLGGAVRDLARAWPLEARYVVSLGALSLAADLASLLPPFDDAIESNAALHEAQHGIVFLAGAAMGIALRDVRLARRGPKPRAPHPSRRLQRRAS
jgi:hypothetical protein